MDVDKKAEDDQQVESGESEVASEDPSLKRKRDDDDDADPEDDHDNKKVKVEEEKDKEEEKEEKADDAGEEGPKEDDTASEKKEETDTKPEEEETAPAAEKEEEKTEEEGEGDKADTADSADSEPAEPSKQDEEVKMEVEESTVTQDTPQVKTEDEQKPPTEVKKETDKEAEAESEEIKTEKLEPKQEPASETEEKSEVVQRRYPTRSRRSEDKGASHPVKVEDRKQGSSNIKEESSHDNDSNGAASVKSDNGSDKENMNSDAAVDLSNAGTPDVIALSDEEQTEEKREQNAKRRKLVRRLQAQLRNEEAKLVLLKKLRQSQLAPQVQDHPPAANTPSQPLTKQTTPRQQGGPPPLVRGSQQIRGSNLHMQQQQQQSRTPNQGQMRGGNVQGPPPLVVTPRMGGGATNGHGGQGGRNSTTHLNQHGSSNHRPVQQSPSVQHPQHAATPPQPPVDTQTPAQRQAAAKLALRKQLEKTLLQIPPPKPPAPEMNFIPSLACPDFVLLLGLEEVVNHIIDIQLIARGQKSPDEKFICNPFTCVQCGTDYTPVWKREKPGSKNVICEHCVTWNQKRALKQEHTNRLKSAFVKALQQEQEIERMQAQTPSNPSTPTPSVTPPTTASSSAPPQALAAAANSVAAAAAMSLSPASFRPSAEQVRQHHSFLQAQAQLRAGQSLSGLQGFGARSPFPYNLPYVKQADLQRQYLLDMIPRAAGMPWKQ